MGKPWENHGKTMGKMGKPREKPMGFVTWAPTVKT
jgi:hypothetical protein